MQGQLHIERQHASWSTDSEAYQPATISEVGLLNEVYVSHSRASSHDSLAAVPQRVDLPPSLVPCHAVVTALAATQSSSTPSILPKARQPPIKLSLPQACPETALNSGHMTDLSFQPSQSTSWQLDSATTRAVRSLSPPLPSTLPRSIITPPSSAASFRSPRFDPHGRGLSGAFMTASTTTITTAMPGWSGTIGASGQLQLIEESLTGKPHPVFRHRYEIAATPDVHHSFASPDDVLYATADLSGALREVAEAGVVFRARCVVILSSGSGLCNNYWTYGCQ
jgi:hypothetical protein